LNSDVQLAIEGLLAKDDEPGQLSWSFMVARLQKTLTVPLPTWYGELLTKYPLAGAYMEYPLHEPDGEYDGFETLRLARLEDIYNETEKAYPGIAIKNLGFACLAIDPTGGGDPYFMKIDEGDNPPVYQVYHDGNTDGAVIVEKWMNKIADSLAEFFTRARVSDYKNPY
jgi:hypothetical protein